MLTFGLVKPSNPAMDSVKNTGIAAMVTRASAAPAADEGAVVDTAVDPAAAGAVPFFKRPWFIPAAIGGALLLALVLLPSKKSTAAD